MKTGNEIYDELKGLNSPLAEMPRLMPYYVPQGYFSTLTNHIKDGVKATYVTEYSLPDANRQNPYTAPKGYFESFPDMMLAIAKEDEQLPSIPTATPYDMPAGYFDTLPQQILQAAKQADKPTKTIPLGKRIWSNVRWAAAAMLVAGLGFGSYKMLQPAPVAEMNVQEELAQLPTSTISDYVQQNIDDFETDMIASNLTSTNFSSPQLSEEEIIQYLDETGWETDNNL